MNPINVANTDAIGRALDAAQDGSSTRMLDTEDITLAVKRAEAKLATLPKRLWKGTRVYVDPHRVPNNYSHSGKTTVATLLRRSSGWALVKVERTSAKRASYGEPADHATVVRLAADVDREELLSALLRHAGLEASVSTVQEQVYG